MVGAVASCTLKGPGTPARCYPVGCRPRRKERKGKERMKACVWQGEGGEAGGREQHSGGRRREREREREREKERE